MAPQGTADAIFDAAMRFVAKWEGGDVDDPADRGGRTSRGITQGAYDDFRDARGLPRQDVFLAKDAEVRAIYRTEYWEQPRINLLPPLIAFVTFDSGVNCGPHRAIEWAQDAIGFGIKVDGSIGPITRAAAEAASEIRVALGVIARRAEHYARIINGHPVQRRFERGWKRRIGDLAREVLTHEA